MAQNLSNLPIGAKIKFGKHSINGETAQDIIWVVAAKNHSGYPSNSVTLITDKIIDLRCFDAVEPNSTDNYAKQYGSPRYELSNIRQWLNSDKVAGQWYETKHTYDQAPTADYAGGSHYANRPGFLNSFSVGERNAILTTSIKYYDHINGTKTLNDKVFIPSYQELTGDAATDALKAEGSQFPYFIASYIPASQMTLQVYNNTLSTSKPHFPEAGWAWWTRSVGDSGENVITIGGSSDLPLATATPRSESTGVRPAMNLSSGLSISDTTDTDGCYTPILNLAPPAPTPLTVPAIYGGKSFNVSWGKSTDPDGHSVTYQLESSVNGAAYTTIYSGTNLSYTTSVPFGTTSVQYRVKAVDSMGASSGYTSSTSKTVINNNAPVISGTNGSLGTKNDGFSHTYSITDAESNTITVTEAIDGVQIRSYVATLGATNTFSVIGNTWVKLANGNHTLTITATDGVDTSVRTLTFVKSVSSFTIQNNTPMVASTMPTRIKVSVTKTIPPGATFKIEVCNNGYDSSPTWEDATPSMNSGLVYLFSNKTKTATNWGVRIRVTVKRNGGSGECYVSSIGGNFE